jgi:hypothetical protein
MELCDGIGDTDLLIKARQPGSLQLQEQRFD